MRTALIILVALLIVSAAISIAVILVGSFDDTELRILATSGVLLATSKSGTLSLRRDQGEMAVFWDSRSRRL